MAPLFLSDEAIHTKSGTNLLGVVKNTTGAGDAVAQKIATTFKTLADKADWKAPTPPGETEPTELPLETTVSTTAAVDVEGAIVPLRLHHDIHIHLPPTSDVGVYRAIFQAMRSELL